VDYGCQPIAPAVGRTVPEPVYRTVVLELGLLFLAMLFMSIATKELAAPEWDLEWLFTMPIPISTLVAMRILERTIVNPTALVLLWPFLSLLSWKLGLGYVGIAVSLACTL